MGSTKPERAYTGTVTCRAIPRVILRDEAQAVSRCLTIQFRATSDELRDIRPDLRRMAVAKASHLRITKQDARQQGERNATTQTFGQAHTPAHGVPDETAGEDYPLNLEPFPGDDGPHDL